MSVRTLTAILSTVSFFWRQGSFWILWALGACDLTCAFSQMPQQLHEECNGPVINTKGLTPEQEGVEREVRDRDINAGAIYRALFTYPWSYTHTHARETQTRSPTQPLSVSSRDESTYSSLVFPSAKGENKARISWLPMGYCHMLR